MNTKLPHSISTVEEAKAFLSELHKNGETFHPEDDPLEINWGTTIVTTEEATHLKRLMDDIYNIPNNGEYPNLVFDPCNYLTFLDNGFSIDFEPVKEVKEYRGIYNLNDNEMGFTVYYTTIFAGSSKETNVSAITWDHTNREYQEIEAKIKAYFLDHIAE